MRLETWQLPAVIIILLMISIPHTWLLTAAAADYILLYAQGNAAVAQQRTLE